jgi:hypothetical protein
MFGKADATSKLYKELYTFIENHFHKNFDYKTYILHEDLIDFVFENSDFDMIKVKKIINSSSDIEIHDGKVYGLFCFTYPEINRILDDATSSSSSDDELYYIPEIDSDNDES